MSEYPKQMRHPAYSPGTSGRQAQTDASGELVEVTSGTPCRFPPVMVGTRDEEDQYRAKGYIAEGDKPAAAEGYHEYPKMLVHPDHVPEVPPEVVGYRESDSGPLLTRTLPGKPAVLPPVIASCLEEELAWNIKGYQMPRLPDPEAMQRANAGVDLDYVPNPDAATLAGAVQEYPKWVKTGKVVDGQEESVLVRDPDEEMAMLSSAGMTKGRIEALIAERRAASERDDEATVARIEKLLADHGIELKDRPHGTVWRRVEKAEGDQEALCGGGGGGSGSFTVIATGGGTAAQSVTAEGGAGGGDPVPTTEDRAAIIAELNERGIAFSKSTPTKHLRALLMPSAASAA